MIFHRTREKPSHAVTNQEKPLGAGYKNDRFSLINKLLLQNCAKKSSNEVKQLQTFSNESTVMPVSITILCTKLKRVYSETMISDREVIFRMNL